MATVFSAPEGFDPPIITGDDFSMGTWRDKDHRKELPVVVQ